jgi:hypothetical protein
MHRQPSCTVVFNWFTSNWKRVLEGAEAIFSGELLQKRAGRQGKIRINMEKQVSCRSRLTSCLMVEKACRNYVISPDHAIHSLISPEKGIYGFRVSGSA